MLEVIVDGLLLFIAQEATQSTAKKNPKYIEGRTRRQ